LYLLDLRLYHLDLRLYHLDLRLYHLDLRLYHLDLRTRLYPTSASLWTFPIPYRRRGSYDLLCQRDLY
jgi:hypothetical protein